MKVRKIVFAGLLSLIQTACMTNGTNAARMAPLHIGDGSIPAGSNYQILQSGAGSDSSVNCPSTYNVVPNYDWDFDSQHSNHYSVCRNKTDPTKLKVYGTTADSNVVCAIPVNGTGSGQNASYTGFIDQTAVNQGGDESTLVQDFCFTPSHQGFDVSFGSNSFSYLFIVTQDDEAQMKECIYTGIYSLCPRYSFGQVN